jgi:FkbM family methyltransferase
MKLEDSLNGNYLSLYGEVVTQDIYHMRDVEDIVSINDPTYVHEKGHKRGFDFIPNVIMDLGANVGIFSRYARELFPQALIVAVEPDPENFKYLYAFEDVGFHPINKAIGNGDMYKSLDAANGAMQCYFSKGPGYNQFDLEELKYSEVKSIMLTDLKKYCHGKTVLKLDIEGNETVIFNDPGSMEMLKTIDYISLELHYFAADIDKLAVVRKITNDALDSLSATHDTCIDNIYFYARKR